MYEAFCSISDGKKDAPAVTWCGNFNTKNYVKERPSDFECDQKGKGWKIEEFIWAHLEKLGDGKTLAVAHIDTSVFENEFTELSPKQYTNTPYVHKYGWTHE